MGIRDVGDPPEGRRRRFFRHPAQAVVGAFALMDLVGTLLLMLPVSRAGEHLAAPFITALFTATSAVCVTGLSTVDTATYWSPFGQVVILCLIQVGGFGIMTLASMLALLLNRRLGLRSRLTAAEETRAEGIGDVRRVLIGVLRITVVTELVIAVVLTVRFALGYDESWGRATYLGVFHAVSSFNNAGFALFSDNLMGFLTDPWVLVPIAAAIIVGGLGFPVISELVQRTKPKRWTVNTKMVLTMTPLLLVGGTVFMTLSEWSNPDTIGALSMPQKVLAGFFHAVQPRTAGFNAWDYGEATQETHLGTVMLMFVGGAPASTAGGIKVTTFLLLLFVIIAEVRGEGEVVAFDRRISRRTIRQALTVALLSVAAVMASTMLLTELTDYPLEEVLFEVVSAFGTVGLSTGLTSQWHTMAQLVLVGLMFLGRLGPTTLASALALRERQRSYTLPEGRPLIG